MGDCIHAISQSPHPQRISEPEASATDPLRTLPLTALWPQMRLNGQVKLTAAAHLRYTCCNLVAQLSHKLVLCAYFAASHLSYMSKMPFFNLLVVVISTLLVLVLVGQEPLPVGEAQHV